jgi:sugar/nucleoside kinase (ribokinase family)
MGVGRLASRAGCGLSRTARPVLLRSVVMDSDPVAPAQQADHPPEVVTVGHAIVDLLVPTEDRVVAELGLAKGTMTLVDDETSERITAALGPTTAVSGGSAANTAAGLASLGASVAFVGKVRDDELGQAFIRDIRAAGVRFDVPAATGGPGTGRSMVMVTPDAEKTMCTSLGAGDFVAPTDIDTELIAAARVVYVEGYLCGLEHTDEAVEATFIAAGAAGTTMALSLSDPFWVELHGKDMDRLLDRVGIVFANEQEACLLTGTDEVGAALRSLADRCETVVITRGPAGSIVAARGEFVEVAAQPVAKVVDTTGAGDLFAAGYLYAHLRGAPVAEAARLGGLASAEVIGHLGARPLITLQTLAAGAGLAF